MHLTNFPEWTIELGVTGSYRVAPPEHPAVKLAREQLPDASLAAAVEQARSRGLRRIFVPVVYEEKEGVARWFNLEPRLHIRGDAYDPTPFTTVSGDPLTIIILTNEVVLVCEPLCATALQAGRLLEARDLAITPSAASTEPSTLLHQRFEALAWQQQLREKAFKGFELLFEAYSLSEELWRLKEWMEKLLPFMLEEDEPRMEKYRALLKKQVGHLWGEKESLLQGASEWYANGSPNAGIDESYVALAKATIPDRLLWLINEARTAKQQRVIELGSIEGVSLFHLIQHAPDIEWHGFERSEKAVQRGHDLSLSAFGKGLLTKDEYNSFHLHHWDEMYEMFEGVVRLRDSLSYQHGLTHNADAVALFEILEHNSPDEGFDLLDTALHCLKPTGGTIYITTPHGNWSAWDVRTRDVNIRKDHVNAFTVERMKKFIVEWSERVAGAVVVSNARVLKRENPNTNEANAWVYAALDVKPRED